MILLDTNVVSEPLRREPDSHVVEWINAQPLETLYLSAITVAELRAGVALLPAGRKRSGLSGNLENKVLALFVGRVLPFDVSCTPAYGRLFSQARAAGLAIAAADGYIAAIAATHGLIVATRDTSPFEAAGVPVVNPWIALSAIDAIIVKQKYDRSNGQADGNHQDFSQIPGRHSAQGARGNGPEAGHPAAGRAVR